jgi:hypothetical protein
LNPTVAKVLGLEHWVCDYDGKELKFPYIKWASWQQYPFFTAHWLAQVLFGDNRVLRFHDENCQRLFFTEGRMREVANQDAKAR